MAQALADRLEASGVHGRDLDEWVLEHSQHEASLVNNAGMERQVAFLLARGETEQGILGAFGLNGCGVSAADLEQALRQCVEALGQLAANPATAGTQFREGGVGHQARQRAEEILERRSGIHGH